MPFFGGSSSAKQETYQANDQGQVNRGSTISQGESVLLGRNANINTGVKYGNVSVGKGGRADVNITYGDGGEAVKDLTNQFLSTIGQLNDGQAQATKTLTEKLAELLSAKQASAAEQQEAEATEGLSVIQKTLFGLGALVLAGVIFWPKKKPV